MMKRFIPYWLSALLCCCALLPVACSKDDEGVTGSGSTMNPFAPKTDTEEDEDPMAPRVTETVRYAEAKMTAINFVYPSTDPYGEPVMLSGTITIGDEVKPRQRARGLLLYNHFTIFHASERPSRGELTAQKIIVGSGLITISSDYYGFGVTEDRMQTYCMSRQNAQASVDALLGAKRVLKKLGYLWNDDILFNMGYSEGGQTTMGVVRLIDEKYPELKLTYTIAGGGAYDIPETYRQFIRAEISGMPSTVVQVLLSYNEFFNLGIPRERMFIEPVLSNIDEWVLSKRYTRTAIDEDLIGGLEIDRFMTAEMLDLNSELSQRVMEVLDRDNLCKGWTPLLNEHILLVHHDKDITVPVANAENMYAFLHDEWGMRNVELTRRDYGSVAGLTTHDTGAVYFVVGAVNKVCQKLGILPWFNPLDLRFL